MIMMGQVVEISKKYPDEWAEMTAWCTEQFGPRAQHINEVAEFSPRGMQGGKWLDSYDAWFNRGDVYFRHEEDAAFFMLRWL